MLIKIDLTDTQIKVHSEDQKDSLFVALNKAGYETFEINYAIRNEVYPIFIHPRYNGDLTYSRVPVDAISGFTLTNLDAEVVISAISADTEQ